MNLYHFSEDPQIAVFTPPRIPKNNSTGEPVVWAIDEEHAPYYFFSRDCPRIAFWASVQTTIEDRNRFFAHTSAKMIIALESRCLNRILFNDSFAKCETTAMRRLL